MSQEHLYWDDDWGSFRPVSVIKTVVIKTELVNGSSRRIHPKSVDESFNHENPAIQPWWPAFEGEKDPLRHASRRFPEKTRKIQEPILSNIALLFTELEFLAKRIKQP